MQLIDCTLETHGEAILAILNDAIVRTTALYDYKPRSMDSMNTWFQAKRAGGFPVIGFVDGDDGQGELLGFASYGSFRNFPAFKYTVEHSVYVHHAHRGKGLGRKLLQAVIERARAQQVHVMVGAIDATNAGSIALHEQLGFKPCGVVQQAGFKFGRWLDLALYQLVLETPEQPVDG